MTHPPFHSKLGFHAKADGISMRLQPTRFSPADPRPLQIHPLWARHPAFARRFPLPPQAIGICQRITERHSPLGGLCSMAWASARRALGLDGHLDAGDRGSACTAMSVRFPMLKRGRGDGSSSGEFSQERGQEGPKSFESERSMPPRLTWQLWPWVRSRGFQWHLLLPKACFLKCTPSRAVLRGRLLPFRLLG